MADQIIAVRICTKCKIELPATPEFFHARKSNKDGCREVCRVCRAAENVKNNAVVTAKKRAHYAANKDRLLEKTKQYYQANVDKQRASGLARHYKNRDLRISQMKSYREENIETLLAAQRERSRKEWRQRYGVDLQYTLRHRVRALLRVSLTNGRKSRRMVEILGYSMEELRAHLERQFTKSMTWEAFMAGQIHIDHIVPASAFDITSDSCEEFKACWSLANLRPMWGSENCAKKDTRVTLL